MKVGKIVIKDKVWFEYYQKALKEYKASKQLVEAENAYFDDLVEYVWVIKIKDDFVIPKNNQLCKAEVKDNKAVIMKLIKE